MYMYCMHVYVSVCIVCMCLYCNDCMNLGCTCLYSSGGTLTIATILNHRFLRRHPAGFTQDTPGHGREHFFLVTVNPLRPNFTHSLPQARWRSLNRPPARLDGVPGRSQLPIWEVASLPVPDCALQTVIDACMYVHVCSCIACICMYYMFVSVCVCMCMYYLYVYVSQN